MDNQAFFKLAYGLYVVACNINKPNGQIANTVFQVTAQPGQIAVSLNKENLICRYLQNEEVFSVSVLGQDTPMEFIGLFGYKSGRDVNKFAAVKYKNISGAPVVLDNAVAYFIARLKHRIDVGTHILFIGEVFGAELLRENQEPMTYAYYHKIKGGRSPKNAPTYIEEQAVRPKGGKMQKYKCKVCGYIYDSEKGDPDSGVAAGTAFEDIPDDWVCPVCGVGKSDFEPVE